MTALACVLLLLAVLASLLLGAGDVGPVRALAVLLGAGDEEARFVVGSLRLPRTLIGIGVGLALGISGALLQRSEEHTSELQSRPHLVCRLLLEKKKNETQHSIFLVLFNTTT